MNLIVFLPCVSFHIAFNAANYLWAKILPLPDEMWAYAVSLIIGILLCLTGLILTTKNSDSK